MHAKDNFSKDLKGYDKQTRTKKKVKNDAFVHI